MSLLHRQVLPTIQKSIGTQVRNMATEKQILMRISATSNIAKITKSMKMVSAAKMRGAQQRLDAGRPFANWLENVGDPLLDVEKQGLLPKERIGENNLAIVITSDRGLCGGCNSIVAKTVRNQNELLPESTKLYIVGEKGRAQLRRTVGNKFVGSVTECWQTATTFDMASAIAELALAQAGEVDKVHIFFNRFVSAIQYSTSIRTVNIGDKEASAEDDDAKSLLNYEFEPDNREEVTRDLAEFQVASAIFHGMIESATSEQSSRMAAMENATNNAQDLIGSLTLVYNKARQARITTELVEIISGASSLDDSN